MILGVATALLFVIVLAPDQAYAWGPVTHLHLSAGFLEQYRDFISSAVPAILQHPLSFLYGCVAPDRFLAKNLKGYKEHTHNWDRAFDMLRFAATWDLQAFCFGYLSHLAADVVAHNLFVPSKMLLRKGLGNRSHSYWELRFEEKQPDTAWQLARETEEIPGSEGLDRFMAVFQSPSVFSYETNLRVTRRVFRMLESDRARRAIGLFAHRGSDAIDDQEADLYQRLCCECMHDVLANREKSRCADADPSGRVRIHHARSVSRALGAAVRRRSSQAQHVEFLGRSEQRIQGFPVVLPIDDWRGNDYRALDAPELGVHIEPGEKFCAEEPVDAGFHLAARNRGTR